MKATSTILRWNAGNYSIRYANAFGLMPHRITGKNTLERAENLAIQNAKINNIASVLVVANGRKYVLTV